MNYCAVYYKYEAIWAWQPFGPDTDTLSFTILGGHYRGYPVVKISDEAKQDIESGGVVTFKYKGKTYCFDKKQGIWPDAS